MNKKVIISLVLIAVMAFGTAFASYAWFTSNATSGNNVFTAGTIALDVNDETDGSFDIALNNGGLVQPGDPLTNGTNGFATITVKNSGTLPMATFGRFTLTDDNGLADDMLITDYKVEFFDGVSNTAYRVDDFIVGGVKSNDLFASNMRAWVDGDGPLDIPRTALDIEALKPGHYYTITFKLAYDKAAVDQGVTSKLGYEVKSTQVNAEAIKALDLAREIEAIHGLNYIDNSVYTYFANQIK